MNFFESQDRVRKNTTLLVGLFALAVVALILMTNLLVMIVFGFIGSEQLDNGSAFFAQMDWKTFATVSAGVALVVAGGSAYKMMALSAGGKVVAESLGGQLIPRNTEDLNQRKLLNVVEEMAIASGTPAPPVYLLTGEKGINAFAAGFSSRDAVLGITQGAIDHLSREQLQGVVAHEFSHIFNGDMRLNIRLMGALNGILILGILGYYLLYSTSLSGRRRSKDNSAAALMALAIGLMVIGFAGTFFGGLIKAAVSRQREYMADASAVQFTRNPNGIAGALKRIGGLEFGSKLANPRAAEASHAFFAQGVSGFMQWLSSTHPPLRERILRIDPQWDGKFDLTDPPQRDREDAAAAEAASTRQDVKAKTIAAAAAGAAVADVIAAVGQGVGPDQASVLHARSTLSRLPAPIAEAAREPHGARAVIYCLVLDKGQAVREQQLKRLQGFADPGVYTIALELMPQMDRLDAALRLPVIDIVIASLKQLSLEQYKSFRGNLLALIAMDSRVDLFEWSLHKIVLDHLDGHFLRPAPVRARIADSASLEAASAIVLSVIAHAGAEDQREVAAAFDASVRLLPFDGLALLRKDAISTADLDRAFAKLDRSTPSIKSSLMKACAASVWHDRQASALEVELLRAFASALECPVPPAVA
ncbi:MAG: M48 family metallopeptidase [Burkholderiaceae bacterium]|jgi:Zn-dependent protease with chaperone function|nr:M48 family metallopeptidase [Burkholderiaceae bacterium]